MRKVGHLFLPDGRGAQQIELEALQQERISRLRRVNTGEGCLAFEVVEFVQDRNTGGLTFQTAISIQTEGCCCTMRLRDGILAELVDMATKYLDLPAPAQRFELSMAPMPKKKKPHDVTVTDERRLKLRARGNLLPVDAAAAAVAHLAPDELAIHRRMLEGK